MSDVSAKASRYQAWLDRLYEAHENNAEKAVSEGYKHLKAEGKKPQEARAILEHDLGKIWKLDTIQRHLPSECKDENMQAVRSKRTEKQQEESERRNTSYEELLKPLSEIMVGADGSNSPAVSPDTVKKIAEALQTRDDLIERLKKQSGKLVTQPAPGGKDEPLSLILNSKEGELRRQVQELESKIAPYQFETKLKIWKRVMTVIVYVQPSIRSGSVSLPKKERERQHQE